MYLLQISSTAIVVNLVTYYFILSFQIVNFTDIEAQIREIQSKKKEISNEDAVPPKERVGLGESGFYDRDIYDGGGKFEGYVTSIAANDEIEVSSLFINR